MANGGNYLAEIFKRSLKNGSSRSALALKPISKDQTPQNYNPNHTDSVRNLGVIKNNLSSLKFKPRFNGVINKPRVEPVDFKLLVNSRPLQVLKEETHENLSKMNSLESSHNLSDGGGIPDPPNLPRILDHDLEYRLLQYEGLDRSFLENVSRVLNIFKSPNPNFFNHLELKVRESFEKLKDFIGPSHLTMMLRSIYKHDKNIDYYQLLENLLRMLNIDELRSLYRHTRGRKGKVIFSFKADKNLEDDIESLLHSIQNSNKSMSSIVNNVTQNTPKDANDTSKSEIELDFDYGTKSLVKNVETRNFLSTLSSESLAKLTSYSEDKIVEICKLLDVNSNKLTLEEAQFILDEIPTINGVSASSVEEKYKILERSGKYFVEKIKSHWVRRPIVVTVMGHVDHGKTSLLDYIHKTDVAKNEKGFITQKISTFQISSKAGIITFIDTPGHAAFLTMRKRGVSCTDLVILVVAADDGIMPQTLECIDLIKKNDLRVLVAINKVDLVPKETIEKIADDVRNHFSDAKIVEISARTGLNVDSLLSEIESLQTSLDLKMDKNSIFKGYIYETLQDPTKGKCINIITKQGSLQPNDYVLINDTIIKVKKIHYPNPDNQRTEERIGGMFNEENNIIQLNVSMNVCSLAGNVIVGNKSLKQLQKYQDLINKQMAQEDPLSRDGDHQDHKIPFVGINLRCEDQGSIEAIENFINEFNDSIKKNLNITNLIHRNYLPSSGSNSSDSGIEVQGEEGLRRTYNKYIRDWQPFKIISKNLGNFNSNDLQLQQIGNIVNIGFNVQNHMSLNNIVRTHDIIYNIFNDIRTIYEFYFGDLFRKKVESNLIVSQIGTITIKGVGKKQAVGTSVKEGQSKLNHFYSVTRNNRVIYSDLSVLSFQSNKENVKQLNKGDNNNCLIFKEDVTVELNDEIVSYVKQPLLPLFDTVTDHLLKT